MPCLKIPATMDETEFKNEVRRLRPQLMVAARRHTGDSDCAEDIVQDALLRLWLLHANLHMPIAPLAFVLVRNLAIDTLRRHKRTTAVETLALAEPVKEVDARYERIVRLLNKLPTLQQTIFRLRHIEGMEICRYRRDNGHHARIGATNCEQSATNDFQTISFYIMQDEQINNLVERFLDGETTLAEEKQLYDYFSQNENVDESLLPYAEYFRDLAVLPSPQKEEKPRKRPRWTIRWTQWAVGAAAAVLISLGGMWLYTQQEEQHLAQLYGGSYMIVDGKRNDNLREIKDDIRQTLADAQQIERQADGQAVIEEAEQEVLESIGDPAERQRLKKILKN